MGQGVDSEEREILINQLRAFETRPLGLVLDTPFNWVIDGVEDADAFFANVRVLLPPDSVLCFEGTTVAPEIANFYSQNRALQPADVRPDTVYPEPDVYHVRFCPEVVERLRIFLRQRPTTEMFDHVKAYRPGSLLLTCHDAFNGLFRISERVPEIAVKAFCSTLGASYRRDTTRKPSRDQFQGLLFALEHPNEVKIRVEPWWRRSARGCAAFCRGWLSL